MTANGENEPGGDDALILALAAGASVRQAAERAGCSPRTVSRRIACQAFMRKVSAVRGQLFDAAVGRLSAGAGAAAVKLIALLQSDQDHVSLAAARSILELGTKLREAGELERRIGALERSGQQGEEEDKEHDDDENIDDAAESP